MGWVDYALAFVVFFLTHSVPTRPPVRPWLVARLGSGGFGLAYSVLSLGVLGWLIRAAGQAPYLPLWHWAPWHSQVVLVAMLPVCLIVAMAIARPNPFSFGGARNIRYDPARPGLVRLTRHPLLVALAVWAGAHLLANGDLAHVMLFGSFAGFALFGMGLLDRRRQGEMGAEWNRLDAARRHALPQPMSWRGALIRLVLWAGLYGGLLGLHPWLFGVSPLG